MARIMVEQISGRAVCAGAWMTVREDEIVHADGTPASTATSSGPASS
ncbi:hypothetical protein [Streptosporangium sp. NPDC048865]